MKIGGYHAFNDDIYWKIQIHHSYAQKYRKTSQNHDKSTFILTMTTNITKYHKIMRLTRLLAKELRELAVLA